MDIAKTIQERVEWIKNLLASSGAKGIIYGNSGGKDCTLVGALCRLATKNVLGVIMPCQSSQNYGSDMQDAFAAGERFDIPQIVVDLTKTKESIIEALGDNLTKDNAGEHSVKMAGVNVNPRLRMTTLYALGQARGYLVAGTGNLDEATLGYFTKWGDGAYDFNPIADLTATEIFAFLEAFRKEDPFTPVVLVPTSFNSVKEEEWKRLGANIVIYANQLMRAAVPAIQNAAETILKNHRAEECDANLMPFKDIIRLIPEE